MGYRGTHVELPIGQGGLHTDDPQTQIPANAVILANNLALYKGLAERSGGSQRWNHSAQLPSGIVQFFDYFPLDVVQRVIVVCKNGKVYRFTDAFNYTEVTPTGSAPTTLNVTNGCFIVAGGQEAAGNQKKLFIFTGNDPIQVISADGTTRSNLTSPASEWSASNYPRFGLIHRNRLFAFGAKSQPHRVYASNEDDHEDFTTLVDILTFNVYPGEFEKINCAWVYKGTHFAAKFPKGLYQLVDQDADSTNWYYTKLNEDFGAASPLAPVVVQDDTLVANSTGSITSLSASFKLGNIDTSDMLSILRNSTYMRQNTSQAFIEERSGIFYEDKKQVYFTYRSPTGTKPDRLLEIDFSHQKAKVTWGDKDQPNVLGLIKDIREVKRPFYGSDDGYIYELDRSDRVGFVIPQPAAPVSALGSGAGNLSAGAYTYKVTIAHDYGETVASSASNSSTVITPAVNGKIELTSIPVDSTGKGLFRNIYRTTAGGSTYYFLAKIGNNVETTYTDNIADASLVTSRTAPSEDSTNNYLSAFQTPHTDFGDRSNKLFDFVEITFEPTGKWQVYCDVYIDAEFSETISFTLDHSAVLDEFTLDEDPVIGNVPRSIRKPIRGFGRVISLKFYAYEAYQNFRIQGAGVYFRKANEKQKASKTQGV